MEKTLTTGEIAKHCGVNFRTVIRWIDKGYIKAYQLPGRGDNRVTYEDFVAFLKSHKMPIPEDFKENASRILVVDDEPNMVQVIQRVLERKGYEVEACMNGFRAGMKLAEFSPSLITLDLKMDGLDGFDVIRMIRETKKFEHVKILIISALSDKKIKEALEKGADAILRKPFENRQLEQKIAELLSVTV